MTSPAAHFLPASALSPYGAVNRGQGAVAFLLVALPLFSLAWLSIEAAHWSATRQALSLALLQAARVGATQGANPHTITTHFQARLTPLTHTTQDWTIAILSPNPQVFEDFTDPDLPPMTGAKRAINNSYLQQQHARYVARNWPDGKGPASQQSIYDANTLTLQLQWAHRPLWAGTSQLLRLLGNAQGSVAQQIWAKGEVPIVRRVSVVMQSHPQDWRGNESSPLTAPPPKEHEPQSGSPVSEPRPHPAEEHASTYEEVAHQQWPQEPAITPTPHENEHLCGVVLCCT